ncbi:MAG: FAD-dependent oxidoreductase [Eubacteriales bacterium]
MKTIETELLIIGGGSSGFGAAYRALRSGIKTILVEQHTLLGGTSTVGGVNVWEPGVSGQGVHYKLAARLMAVGDGFVGKTTEFSSPGHPYALSDRCSDDYESTLHRFGVSPEDQRRFHFEPTAMDREMRRLLDEAGGERLTLLTGSRFVSLEKESDRITAVKMCTLHGNICIRPRFVIDCTGNIDAARAAGCGYDIGENSIDEFSEAIAPAERSAALNGITQCFRVEPGRANTVLPDFSDIDLSDWHRHLERLQVVSCFSVYPKGGIGVNMLPTIDGESLLKIPYPNLKRICEARVYTYWQWIADNFGFGDWHISGLSPLLGIRESFRLRGKYVLRYEDLINGFVPSLGNSHTVAYADHPADTHGAGGMLRPTGIYGIPYECMLPLEISNLLVACRGASFSHIAASSARLSRTMLALGEAAGAAAAYCLRTDTDPREVPSCMISSFLPDD